MRTVSETYLSVMREACRAHAIKTYDGKPYHVHLEEVEDVLIEFGYGNDEDMLLSAWLHDAMEDVGYTKNDIKKLAGPKVADIVYLVTDHKGANREERKPLEYYQALTTSPNAIVIKLADRIANARNSIKNNHSMGVAYIKEYKHFKEMLYICGHAKPMWDELDRLLN